jgi:hypothetical protein
MGQTTHFNDSNFPGVIAIAVDHPERKTRATLNDYRGRMIALHVLVQDLRDSVPEDLKKASELSALHATD